MKKIILCAILFLTATSFLRSQAIDSFNAAKVRAYLGLGTSSTLNVSDFLKPSDISTILSPYQLAGASIPESQVTGLVNDLGAKEPALASGTSLQYYRGDKSLATFPITTAPFANSTNKNFVTDAQLVVIGNTAGSNNGDNAANSTYANDYRAGNFVAGINYLAPNGNGSALTGLTSAQVGLGNATNESKATMFNNSTFTGTFTVPSGVITNANLAGSIAASKLVGSDIVLTESQVTNLTNDLGLKANLTSPTLVTPIIGVATGTSLAVTGSITSSGTAGIGYATGAGGTVTQATSKSTGVTLNKIAGEITLNSAALASATVVSFTLTNSTIAATDILVLNHVTTGTRGAYTLNAQCAAGSAVIYVRNNTAGSLSEAIVIRFVVIKSVNN
jgi:hypothetical protein